MQTATGNVAAGALGPTVFRARAAAFRAPSNLARPAHFRDKVPVVARKSSSRVRQRDDVLDAGISIAPHESGDHDVVDFEQFRKDIIIPGGDKAEKSYRTWLARGNGNTDYDDIQALVHGFRHDFLYAITVEELERVTLDRDPTVRTGHALSDIDPKRECIRAVDDFNTPWAMQYLLHGFLERHRRIPRWEDFERFFKGAAKLRYYEPFKARFGYDRLSADEIHRFERALQWRIGNAYYSCLREIDLITRLRREYDLPVRYHMLADVQFKIDIWCENVLIAVYIKNERYRDGEDGRKVRLSDMLDVSNFQMLEIELEAPRRFGRPALVTPQGIEKTAEAIRSAMGRK